MLFVIYPFMIYLSLITFFQHVVKKSLYLSSSRFVYQYMIYKKIKVKRHSQADMSFYNVDHGFKILFV